MEKLLAYLAQMGVPPEMADQLAQKLAPRQTGQPEDYREQAELYATLSEHRAAGEELHPEHAAFVDQVDAARRQMASRDAALRGERRSPPQPDQEELARRDAILSNQSGRDELVRRDGVLKPDPAYRALLLRAAEAQSAGASSPEQYEQLLRELAPGYQAPPRRKIDLSNVATGAPMPFRLAAQSSYYDEMKRGR